MRRQAHVSSRRICHVAPDASCPDVHVTLSRRTACERSSRIRSMSLAQGSQRFAWMRIASARSGSSDSSIYADSSSYSGQSAAPISSAPNSARADRLTSSLLHCSHSPACSSISSIRSGASVPLRNRSSSILSMQFMVHTTFTGSRRRHHRVIAGEGEFIGKGRKPEMQKGTLPIPAFSLSIFLPFPIIPSDPLVFRQRRFLRSPANPAPRLEPDARHGSRGYVQLDRRHRVRQRQLTYQRRKLPRFHLQ